MFGINRSVDIETSIKKAVSVDDSPPKRKHVRACIVYTWDHKTSKAFWESLKGQPIRENDISLFKSLILIHKVLQEGHPSCLIGGFKNLDWIESLDSLRTNDRRFQLLLGQYVAYLSRKLRFHHNHRGFNGTFEYEEYVSLSTVSDPNEGYDAILDLLSLQDALDEFGRYLLDAARSIRSECVISALVPVIAESYGIYKFLISMLRAMYRTSDTPDILRPLAERFHSQHERLYDLYSKCSQIKYLNTLVTIPKLPFDAPTLIVREGDVEPSLPALKEQKTGATALTRPNASRSQSIDPQASQIMTQPTGAANAMFLDQQRAYEEQQAQLQQQQQQQLLEQQQAQSLFEQQQQQLAAQQQAEMLAQQQQMMLQQQATAANNANGRVQQLENDVLILKGQYDKDQMMLQNYDQRVQSLEQELQNFQQNMQQQLGTKEEQITYLTEQVNYWKTKYESLAKLYSQLRQEHLNLLAKNKKVAQKAASAQEAIDKREKLERDMKAKNIELADLIRERDRAKLELERFKHSNDSDYQKVLLEKNELEEKLATLDRAQSANLTAIFTQHTREMKDLEEKLKSTSLSADPSSPLGQRIKDLEDKLQDKDIEIEMLQQTMDETVSDLINQQKESETAIDDQIDEVLKQQSFKFTQLIDAVLKSGIKKIQDAVFELDSPMQGGNMSASPEYLATLIEKSGDLSTEFSNSFNDYLVDGIGGDNEATVIDTITNFTTSIGDVLLNTKGLTRLTKIDDFQDDLVDTARDVALICEVFLEALISESISSLSLEDKTEKVINGNVDVQEVLQTLQELVGSLKVSHVDLDIFSGELSEIVDQEMQNASKIIDQASSHLAQLLNKQPDPELTELDLEVNKSILSCASAIIAAVKLLINSSIKAQDEIVKNGAEAGGVNRTEYYKKNNKWTEGLISASKSVSSSATGLISIADGLVSAAKGKSTEELIVASNQVAASTAQLVSAARVKSSLMTMDSQEGLENASKKVNGACRDLVHKVGKLVESKEDWEGEVERIKGLSGYQSKSEEMEQLVEILKLEKALAGARKRLGEIRRWGYREGDSDEE